MFVTYATPAATDTASADERETARLEELKGYGVLDTAPEPQFDSIVALARVLFDTPIAAVTLVDHDRQWFKAKAGLAASETPREDSFCAHAMEHDAVFVVPDASLDPRFATNPNVTGDPKIRFYAGAPLHSSSGHNLGAMCVISPTPREFSYADRKKLEILADIVGNELELKKQAQTAHKMLYEKDFEVREAHFRVRNSLDYATLLADVQSADMPVEKLAALAMASWQQYSQAGGILNSSIKMLRSRMSKQDYQALLDNMPGFAY